MELKGKTDDLKFQWKNSLNNTLQERKKCTYNLPMSPSWCIIPDIVFSKHLMSTIMFNCINRSFCLKKKYFPSKLSELHDRIIYCVLEMEQIPRL